jgi:hypothetical protein
MNIYVDRAWVVLVTRGAANAFPPELYSLPGRAVLEAERWASALVPESADVHQAFEARWNAGDFEIRLVEIDWTPVEEPWIGTFWDRSGTPDPEALLLDGRGDAVSWVSEPIALEAESPTVVERPWYVSGSTIVRGEEVYAVAQLAKVIG